MDSQKCQKLWIHAARMNKPDSGFVQEEPGHWKALNRPDISNSAGDLALSCLETPSRHVAEDSEEEEVVSEQSESSGKMSPAEDLAILDLLQCRTSPRKSTRTRKARINADFISSFEDDSSEQDLSTSSIELERPEWTEDTGLDEQPQPYKDNIVNCKINLTANSLFFC